MALAYAALVAGVSALVTWALARRGWALDAPNERSSHERPTPRLGGFAIVGSYFAGLGLLQLVAPPGDQGLLLGLVVSSAVIALAALYDDLRTLGFKAKLAFQTVAAIIAVAFGLSVESLGPVALGALGPVLTVVWLVGFTNAFNFMDGLDGLAGGTAALAGLALALLGVTQGGGLVAAAGWTVAAACLGFLIFNAPPARIFMGDVGSQFLGFTFAALAVIASRQQGADLSILVVPLLLFHFIWDTAFTMARRALAGENIARAHRTHLYQLMNRIGYSHRAVSLYHCAVTAAQALGAWLMPGLDAEGRVLVFLPFVALQTVYTVLVIGAARRRGLLPGPAGGEAAARRPR